MKYDKEKINDIITEIIVNNIGDRSDSFEKELVDKIRNCKSNNEAIGVAMSSYYIEGLFNTKTIIVEALDKILNGEKSGD